MQEISLLIVLSVSLISVNGRDPISYIEVCKADDPNLNKCVKDTANTVIPLMSKGIEEYGVPPLDPMFIPKMDLTHTSRSVSIKLAYTDVTQIGLSRMMVDDVAVDMANGVWIFNMTEPVFIMSGKYSADGTLLNKPLNGEGEFNSTFNNCKVEGVFHVVRDKRDGDEFFRLTKLEIVFSFGTAIVDYENLFHGDKKLGAETNTYMSEHSHQILMELKPAYEKFYSEMFTKYLQGFFDKEPVSKLFPGS